LFTVHSSRDDPGAAARHAAVLRTEGVEVGTNTAGKFRVDFGAVGWFPEVLPSEEEEEEEEELGDAEGKV
jgi:methylated-DNA-protein-cysteine methyltransferase-like protein